MGWFKRREDEVRTPQEAAAGSGPYASRATVRHQMGMKNGTVSVDESGIKWSAGQFSDSLPWSQIDKISVNGSQAAILCADPLDTVQLNTRDRAALARLSGEFAKRQGT